MGSPSMCNSCLLPAGRTSVPLQDVSMALPDISQLLVEIEQQKWIAEFRFFCIIKKIIITNGNSYVEMQN